MSMPIIVRDTAPHVSARQVEMINLIYRQTPELQNLNSFSGVHSIILEETLQAKVRELLDHGYVTQAEVSHFFETAPKPVKRLKRPNRIAGLVARSFAAMPYKLSWAAIYKKFNRELKPLLKAFHNAGT